MSLPSLPTELKEQIVRAAHVNDLDLLAKGSAFPDTEYGPEGEFPTEFRYPRRPLGRGPPERTGDPPELRWDAWLGRSARALSCVNREFREMALPLILKPLDTSNRRLNIDERLASATARYSRSLVLAAPHRQPHRPAQRLVNGRMQRDPPTPAQQRDAFLAERNLFLKYVDAAAESMPLLKNITVHSSISSSLFQPIEDITEDKFASGGNDDARPDGWQPSTVAPSVPPQVFLLNGGFPTLTRLANRIDSWTFSSMPSSVIAAFLSIAPTKVRAIWLAQHPVRRRRRPPFFLEGDPEEGLHELLEAVRGCTRLERLSIEAPSVDTPGGTSWPPVLASLSASLSFLHLRLVQPAPFLRGLLNPLPSLRQLHLDTTGGKADKCLLTLASCSNANPLVALPALASLQVTAVELATVPAILRLISTPNLQLLTLDVRLGSDEPPRADEHTPLALAQLVTAALPALRVLRCSRISDYRSHYPTNQPCTSAGKQLYLALDSLKAELALSSPSVHVELDNPDPDSYTAAAALSPGKSALELARWAVRELEKAEHAGDEGQARLVRGSLEGVVRLQNLLKP